MFQTMTRTNSPKGALAALGAIAPIPDWAVPRLADGDTDVPFTDLPQSSPPGLNAAGITRI